MKVYDISMDVKEGMVIWPGDHGIKTMVRQRMPANACNVSVVEIGTHTGTHVDAPKHFVEDGKGVDSIPLENLCGPCKVIDLSGKESICAEDLATKGIDKDDIVLLKTDNSCMSMDRFNKKFTYITIDAAKYLVEKRVRTVGIDYLSIAKFGDSAPVHKVLLEAEITIIEGLRLGAIPEGKYKLCCLPIRLVGMDGAPARAVLISE